MRELFRERDFTKVGFFQSILESEGVPTFVRNEHLTSSGLTEIPIPEFFPALCVVNDEDYDRAINVLRERAIENEENAEKEVDCPSCSEKNPGNFDVCWFCDADLKQTEDS